MVQRKFNVLLVLLTTTTTTAAKLFTIELFD
jgi:hypothetical protein